MSHESSPPPPPIRLTAGDGTSLELVHLEAKSVVRGPLAFTELRLGFDNPQARTIEGRFSITLPQRASLSRFAMRIGTQWKEGEVVERKRARRIYEDYLHKRIDPALLEQGAGNEFTARVFPIAANARKDLILSYSQELSEQERTLVPLRGLPAIGKVDLAVSTAGGSAPPAQQLQRAVYIPDQDFLVDPQLLRAADGLRHGKLAMRRVVPVATAPPEPIRSALLLVDTSASRALGLGAELKLVEQLVARLVSESGAAAPLVVACFDQSVELIYQGEAGGFGSDSLRSIEQRRALGASDLRRALRWARKQATKTPFERAVLISDGVVTAGRDEGTKLRRAAKDLARSGVKRLDTVAVGGIRDDALLASLGTAGLSTDGAFIDGSDEVSSVWRKLTQATVSQVAIRVDGASWWWPKQVDGAQPGDEVLVYAQLPPAKAMQVRVDGRPLATPQLLAVERPLLERAWARAKIASLQDRERRSGKTPQLREQIVKLSTAHRVLSPYTALLVLETEDEYRQFGLDRTALADILTVQAGSLQVQGRSSASPPVLPQAPRASSPGGVAQLRGGVQGPPQLPPPGAPPGAATAAAAANPSATGQAYGAGGLGLSGIGEGGGGTGQAIGLGSTGTIGHGAGTGTGQGFGSGHGRLGRSHRARPPRVRMGATSVSGRLPPEVIQRIVRQNFGRFRACYRTALLRNATLAGRVAVRFVIGRSGKVASVAAGGDLPDQQMQQCVARAFYGVSFPQPEGGIVTVTYPILFTPDGNLPAPPPPAASQPPTIVPPPPRTATAAAPRAPSAPPKKRINPYEGRFAEIMSAVAEVRTADALRLAQAWHADAPGDVLALIALGEALELAGRLDWAARAYGSIIDMYPTRADLRRYAGSRLERLGRDGLALAVDTYRKALAQRPDHPSSHRLYAFALVKSGRHAKAFEVLAAAHRKGFRADRFPSVRWILGEDVGLVAAAWIAAEPKQRSEVLQRLRTAKVKLEQAPSLRFVLTWETDANDVDFHIHDDTGHAYYSHKKLPSGGELYADATRGYGPECFTVRKAAAVRSPSYRLEAHYYSRGPMGYGMGKVQIVEHDGQGGLSFEDRPFLVMKDRAYVDLGTVRRAAGQARVK